METGPFEWEALFANKFAMFSVKGGPPPNRNKCLSIFSPSFIHIHISSSNDTSTPSLFAPYLPGVVRAERVKLIHQLRHTVFLFLSLYQDSDIRCDGDPNNQIIFSFQ